MRILLMAVVVLSTGAALAVQESKTDSKTPTKSTTPAKPDGKAEAKAETKTEAKSEKADDKKSPAAAAEKKTPADDKTHRVKREFLKEDVKLTGLFEASETAEIKIRPETWSDFTVEKAVPHGTRIKKGEPLIVFEMKKIDEELASTENAVQSSKLAFELAVEELKYFEKILPLDVELAELTKQRALEDYKRYQEVDRALSIKMNEFSLRISKLSLESAQEELKQLEKMYRAEDLREESEEIVIKRARDSVESSKFFLESAQARYEEFNKLSLLRRDEGMKDGASRAEILYTKAKASNILTSAQKKTTHEKAKADHDKIEEKLVKLKKDRSAMSLTAPMDGIVYYGKCTRGAWASGSGGTPVDLYQVGQSLRGDEVWMTIVKTRPMFIRTTLKEEEVKLLRPGAIGKANPAFDSDQKLEVRLTDVALYPLGGSFDAKVALTGADDPGLSPGMTCKLKFSAIQKEAIAIPSKMVFSEERDEDDKYVLVRTAAGKTEKRVVSTGRLFGEKLEILKGLSEGELILTEKQPEKSGEPGAEKAPSPAK